MPSESSSSRARVKLLEEKLDSNISYQKCMDALLLKFGSMRAKARDVKAESKKTILALKFKYTEPVEYSSYKKTFKSIKQLGAPYFKDDKGFSPSKNNDELIMEKMGFINISGLQPPIKWQHWEMKLLDETVRKVALGSMRRPLIAQQIALQDQLKLEQGAKLNTAPTKLRLEQVNKDIEKLSGEMLFEHLNDPEMEHDWCRISVTEFENLRSPLELRAMWRQCLVLTLERKPWTSEETQKLRDASAKHSFENWNAISSELGGRRSAYQCFLHYQSILNKRREGWSSADDKKLKVAVKAAKHGKFVAWEKVAEHLPGRSVTQIIARWTQHLDPKIKSSGYTERDDMILRAAKSQKMSFRQIGDLLPGRTESQLRIRYTRLECFKPSVPWMLEDDQKLMALAKQFKGSKDIWAIVNDYFPDRDRQQLKGRFKRLLNDAAGVKNTLPRKGKKSIWSLNKRRTTPIFNVKNVVKFANQAEKAGKVGRKGKKKDPLDLEFDQVFRSHYAQPKGRRRKYHPNAADPVSVIEGLRLSKMLGVNFDWRSERRLEVAAANDPDFHSVLNVFRQLKMRHNEDHWDSGSATISQLTPPNKGTLIGLRTLLLEERNILAMSLQNQQEIPVYLRGVVEKADQVFNPPETEDFASGSSGDQCPAIPPALALSLFKQRFFSLFLWPSMMTQIAPSLDYKKNLFEGERMACASSDEDEVIENMFLDFKTDSEDSDGMDIEPGNEERKAKLREKWLKYREQKMKDPPSEEKQLPLVLQRKRRLPKKRGRKKLEAENWLQTHMRNNIDSPSAREF